mmetsp:Transcript_33197/g.53210  ORF Transcript_33197/g.53210 Transcript_33197/m.53210 type:complete len:298 (+) Transcript_33197:180-1073(+)
MISCVCVRFTASSINSIDCGCAISLTPYSVSMRRLRYSSSFFLSASSFICCVSAGINRICAVSAITSNCSGFANSACSLVSSCSSFAVSAFTSSASSSSASSSSGSFCCGNSADSKVNGVMVSISCSSSTLSFMDNALIFNRCCEISSIFASSVAVTLFAVSVISTMARLHECNDCGGFVGVNLLSVLDLSGLLFSIDTIGGFVGSRFVVLVGVGVGVEVLEVAVAVLLLGDGDNNRLILAEYGICGGFTRSGLLCGGFSIGVVVVVAAFVCCCFLGVFCGGSGCCFFCLARNAHTL